MPRLNTKLQHTCDAQQHYGDNTEIYVLHKWSPLNQSLYGLSFKQTVGNSRHEGRYLEGIHAGVCEQHNLKSIKKIKPLLLQPCLSLMKFL